MRTKKSAGKLFLAGLGFLLSCFCSFAQRPVEKPDDAVRFSTAVKDLRQQPGYFPFYYDPAADRILLLIDKLNSEFLFVESLTAAVGSNDLGLDRNQLGSQRIVKFVRAGEKIFMVQPNVDFRAVSDNVAERKAVEESFAQSILFGFKVLAQDTKGNPLVDATEFFIQDIHGVSDRLRNADEGSYSLDPSRSAFYTERTKNFPKNSEFEVTLTFRGEAKGKYLPTVVPTPSSLTVREHFSFVQLPDDDYKPRVYDPRAGFFDVSYFDYAKPFTEPIQQRLIVRHRLKKKDPSAAISEAVKPIVYYVDPGAPPAVQKALIEGASWWDQAFEAAGYKHAFRVQVLPQGADPMDVRYNMIHWVHRSTRGWSYGTAIINPRTGEILKGNVNLGSLRDRQDFLIAEGLLAPYEDGAQLPADLERMTLARLRQLSAHEVGHTLGLAHAYTSSTEDRASVMDYPQPLVKLVNGKINISDAYDDKIGLWDKAAITYGYQDYPAGTDEAKAGDEMIQASLKQGLTFLSDDDARPAGGAHPYAHLWDNGKDVAEELTRMMEIRTVALARFGPRNIRPGSPMALLEEVLVPVYFYHRYQAEATAKLIGGLNYRYAMKGDGQLITAFISPEQQSKALEAILKTISPNALMLPENLLKIIPPRPMGFSRHRELPGIRTELTFDPLSLAESAAAMSIDLILHPARANRLIEYHARDASQPGLEKIIDAIITATIKAPLKSGMEGEIQRTVNTVFVRSLSALVVHDNSAPQTKAVAVLKLTQIGKAIREINSSDEAWVAHALAIQRSINLLLNSPEKFNIEKSLPPPPGMPIGME